MAASGYATPLVRTRSATPLTPLEPRLLTVNTLPCFAGVSGPAAVNGDTDYFTSRRSRSQSCSSEFSAVGPSAGGLPSARNVYNPARHAVYARYTTNDWANYNKANQRQSGRERATAEQLRDDAWQTVRLTDQRTRIGQSDASKKLNERLKDIEYWRIQLADETKINNAETQKLAEHLRVLESSLAHTANPLLMSEECLMHREKRIGIDQVHDDVERQLTREIECIRKCQDQLRRMVDRAKAQLKLNRAALHELDKDLKNKSHARSIDDRLCHLQNHSPGIAYHPGIEAIDNSLSIPDSWARFSQENIARSQKCRASSERLRGAIGTLLRSCANEMWSQYNTVNGAFSARIREITDARNSLQGQLQYTVSEIFAAERAIGLLRRAIADKEAPMKVAQTRLEERTRRVDVEICSDAPTNALQREVLDIREALRTLKERLKSMESALSRLNQTRSSLEADIRVKENSLHIDVKCCMGMRKTLPMDPRAGPI